jgi:hypothetical protein
MNCLHIKQVDVQLNRRESQVHQMYVCLDDCCSIFVFHVDSDSSGCGSCQAPNLIVEYFFHNTTILEEAPAALRRMHMLREPTATSV